MSALGLLRDDRGRKAHSSFVVLPVCAIRIIVLIVARPESCEALKKEDIMEFTLSNLETVPGRNIIAYKGLVQGNTVRSKHVGRDIMAGLKNIVGGELRGYTELLEDARNEATNRMIENAREMGANAVVNVRFSTSAITAGASELYVYGTAVLLD